MKKTKKRSNAPDKDAQANEDPTNDHENDDDGEEETRNPAGQAASREAARYRVQRNEARQERDSLRAELAFVKAAGSRFTDVDEAWKLVDLESLEYDDDGNVTGLDELIESLGDDNPFLLAVEPDDQDDDDDSDDDDDPFKRPSKSAVKSFNSAKQNHARNTRASLANKYPVLRGR